MPLHVVCRGEECRSVTSVIFPRRQMERWMEASSDIVYREAPSVEDPEGVGDDPGVGHEAGVDPGVEEGPIVVVVFVLLLELNVELLFELLFDFRFGFLLDEALPVRAEGAGTLGEGDLGGGQPNVEGQLALLGEVRQLAGQRLRIRQFHNRIFSSNFAGIVSSRWLSFVEICDFNCTYWLYRDRLPRALDLLDFGFFDGGRCFLLAIVDDGGRVFLLTIVDDDGGVFILTIVGDGGGDFLLTIVAFCFLLI